MYATPRRSQLDGQCNAATLKPSRSIYGSANTCSGSVCLGRWSQRRALASQLFGIGPADPRVLVVITISLTAIAMIASLRPARGASRVDVMKTLEAE